MQVIFTKAEVDYLVNLMHEECRAKGLPAVKPEMVSVIQKFTNAVQEASQPPKDD